MALTAVQEALKQPGARAVLAAIFQPRDPNQDGATVDPPLCVADTGLWTPPTGPNPGLSFKVAIAEGQGLVLAEYLSKPGQLSTPKSELTAGRMVLDLDDSMVAWLGYDWNDSPVQIYIGALTGADGAPLQLSDFDTHFVGAVEDFAAIGDKQAEVTFKDVRLGYDKEFSDTFYVGLGGAFPFRTQAGAPVGTYLEQAHSPGAMNITGEMTIEWFGHIESVVAQTNSAYTPIIMNGDNGLITGFVSVNYGLFIKEDAGGELAFGGGLDGSSHSEVISSGFAPAIGAPIYFCVVVSGGGTALTFYRWNLGSRDPVVLIGTATLTNAVAAGPTDGFRMGQALGSNFVSYETRLHEQALTFEEIKERCQRTLSEADGLAGLRECWRYGEGDLLGLGPERVFGEKGVINLIPVGDDPIWVPSYTGDMPDQFQGSVAGKSKSVAIGPSINVRLTKVDTQRSVFAWDNQQATAPSPIRMRGVPMVPAHEVRSTAPGQIVFATDKTITISGTATDFSRFVPGQSSPDRLGQRVTITGSALNNGTFRVAAGEVSANTLTLEHKTMAAESAPADCAIASFEKDEQYEVDEALGVATIDADRLGDISGDVTADLPGRLPAGGTAYYSELFEMVTGIAPDTSALTFDPVLGWWLADGSGMSTNQILDAMARSVFGWWVERPDGSGHRIGTFLPPSGSSVADLRADRFGSSGFEVEALPNSPIPFFRFACKYAKNWTLQQSDALATSVRQADRQRWAEPYQEAQRTNQDTLVTYPAAKEHPGFETWIHEIGDANAFNEIALPLTTQRTKWVKISWPSFWPLFIQMNDVVTVTWDDPSLRLSSTSCRVTGRIIDTGAYTIALEAFYL